MTLSLSMASFALAASISPGPVNLVSLSSGSRRQMRTGLAFVSGATLGFIALFIATGLGLHGVLVALPELAALLRWGGVLFLLYLSWQLLISSGELPGESLTNAPGFWAGALMQWLNPKAWLASASGISAYASGGDTQLLWLFAAIYAPICWVSLCCWLYAGAWLQAHIRKPERLKWLNRSLALLLLISCAALIQ
ncbi:lysine transporter LysE [Bacterioplanes sanyensis]|uniref:Lysine transporter LysE n=1 Tax=Bacterioplanes sanyensis TaxID=1249553 RepID=A0A222FR36_9GAMM|nr:lysine transporter LysE [Bacterioplanes sanyensis]